VKSLGTRLALWYASAATVTLACLIVAGYYLLEINLVHGLDYLNQAQFEELKAHLGKDYASLNAQVIDTRIRETTEYASVLFFISIDNRAGPVRQIFYSTNLRGREIPDIRGKHVYDAELPGTGELRVGEFILGPFDVTVATPRRSVTEALHDYSRVCLWLLAAAIAVSGGIGLGLSQLALRPVRSIRETARHISSDNLSERIPVGTVRDEISELALLLNLMFDRLEASFQQIRRFTAEASHELKTPLSLIRLQAERLLVNGDLSPANAESVHVQLEELSRLSQIIEELLFLSRAEAQEIRLNLAPHDPGVLLDNFSQDARVLTEHKKMVFVCTHEGHGCVHVEPRWLRRVLLNLLTNALSASAPGGKITLRSSVAHGSWRVTLHDEGRGVPEEFLDKIFERFVRLAPANSDDAGSGLGLAICRSIMTLHGGIIWAEPAPGGGLCVAFTLPVTGAIASAPRDAPSTAHSHPVLKPAGTA